MEGQALRDSADRFDRLGVRILGASFDSPAENRAFAEAQGFPFLLLSDTERAVGRAYHVARGPGDKFAGFPRRHSYLIDPAGLIHRGYDVTDVEHHADEVLADVEQAEGHR